VNIDTLHFDFRNYGLGRAALCETLQCFQEPGAERIFVETDDYRNAAMHLYKNAGFRVSRQVWVYGKDYNHARGLRKPDSSREIRAHIKE
jgi:ribosomal protein S18 acetylase RimI-like enzyme